MHLLISCLGNLQVSVNDQPLIFATDHARALLAYLAVEADRPHNRSYLAALLWPERPEIHAMQNLRQTLLRLREALGDVVPLASILHITPKTLQFNSDNNTLESLDLHRFQRDLEACKTHEHRRLEACPECMRRLEQAVQLYRGDFLQGLSVRNSQPFEEWAGYLRQRLHAQALSALQVLANHYEEAGDSEQARGFVARQLLLEPWLEEAHRQMMRLLATKGQRSAALLQYESCRQILQKEMGVEPTAETRLLYEEIRAGGFERISKAKSGAIVRAGWEDVPLHGRLYGREADAAQLATWLVRERSQLVVIVGMGGIGKTVLAATAVEAAAPHFDLLVWRSLLNAPALDEILREWLVLLAPEHSGNLPESLDGQLAMLLQTLRNRRCLLVLDNVESIFQPSRAGEMQPEYRGYGQLFTRVAEVRHQSCLLLTSREQPQAIAAFAKNAGQVHTLRIAGLDRGAAQALLKERNLVIDSAQAAALVSLYSGNPLALKLAADTIQELFNSDVVAFLATEVVIFDDIRSLLEQQFSRLTALEREVLMWLAIEREALSLEQMRANLAPARAATEVMQAVRALQRRSLLERAGQGDGGFVAPNVVMEYLVDRLVEEVCAEICEEIEQGCFFWLHSHALMQAQAKEYVRQSQTRLILQRVANGLVERWGRGETERHLLYRLHALHGEPLRRGYAAGNLLNLLIFLEVDIAGLDLSGLTIWQADLRRANLAGSNLTGADLSHSRFADALGIVFSLACSPDSARVAAGTRRGEIRLWRTASGQLIHLWQAHQGCIRALAYRSDGQLLASAGDDHRVCLWRIQEAPPADIEWIALVRQLLGHTGRVTALRFHPNGEMLASASVDGTIRLWDTQSGTLKQALVGHEHWVWSLAYSPDGRILASGSLDRTIRLWDADTGELLASWMAHQGMVSALAFDPRGERLASGSFDGGVCVWEISSGRPIYRLEGPTEWVRSIAYSPDGALLAEAREDGIIRVFQEGALQRVLQAHRDGTLCLAFTPDGETLVSGGMDQMVCLYDRATWRARQLLMGYSQHIHALAYHPNGKLLASGHFDCIVRLWNPQEGALVQQLPGHTHNITTLAFSADGRLLASGGEDMAVLLWSVATESSRESETRQHYLLRAHAKRLLAAAFQPDGEGLVSGSVDLTVCHWDLASGQPRQIVQLNEAPPISLALSPGGRLVASGGDRTLWLWNAESGQLYAELPSHYPVMSLAFAPDEQWLACGDGNGTIRLWNLCSPTEPELVLTLHGHSDRVLAFAFHPHERLLVSGGADHTVRLWELQNGQAMRTLVGHSDWVHALAISPDGQTIASGGFDATIRLWDRHSGHCHAILRGPRLYEGMNIRDVTGIDKSEKAVLKVLGAIEQ